MVLKKLYLDYAYRDALERIAVAEGWATREREEFGGDHVGTDYEYGGRNVLKARLLRLLTLFETVDTNFTALDCSRLIDAGIIQPAATMYQPWRPIVDGDATDLPESVQRIREHGRTVAHELLRASRLSFVRLHIRKSPPNYYSQVNLERPRRVTPGLSDLPVHYYPQYWGRYSERDLVRNFRRMLDQVFADDTVDEDALKPYALVALAHDLLTAKWNLQDCIALSAHEQACFATVFCGGAEVQTTTPPRLLDDLYYLVKTRLTDEVLVLPEPRSLKDVTRLRTTTEMKRFREVLSSWCEALQHGDETAEVRIRRDLRKANRALRVVRGWREYERSPINFWMNAIGGHIPILSNVLTVINTVGTLYSNLAETRCRWLMLAQRAIPGS